MTDPISGILRRDGATTGGLAGKRRQPVSAKEQARREAWGRQWGKVSTMIGKQLRGEQ